MTQYSGTSLVIRIKGITSTGGGNNSVTRRDGTSPEEVETLVKFLTRVRGPNAQDEPLRVFPRPRGSDTKVIVTEYELPQSLLALHDAQGDSKGKHLVHQPQDRRRRKDRSASTGIVTEYRIPLTPKAHARHARRGDR